MIRIGDFAKICNVSTQTLRYYDTVGVLKADVIDSSNGYRFYSLDAIEKYKQILFYKELGFSLSEIKAINLADKAQQNIILQQRKQVLAESMKMIRMTYFYRTYFLCHLKMIQRLLESGDSAEK